MKTYRTIQALCRHPKEHQYIHLVHAALNCETTVIKCGLCGKHLTEPKTDC